MVNMTGSKYYVLLMLVVIALAGSVAGAATVTVTTDRNQVGLNESFTMTFESDSSVDDEPDFSPLNKDFQILSRNSSSNMSIINGKISTSKKWQLTVLARRAGKLIIPPVSFGKDQSQPSFVNVSSSGSASSTTSSSREIFIEVEATPDSPYVQAQVIYTVRLFLSVATSNASLSEPGISGANAVIERLGEDSNYQTTRRGKRYNVVERKYAIYPQVSGSMSIEPVMFQGQISRNAFSLFDPFGPQPKTVIERSDAITLDVKPIPEQFPTGQWVPAQVLTLSESWSQDPPQFRVGEPLTRTLTLSAAGLTASQLPELPDWVPDSFKQYPDQPALNDSTSSSGISANRQEKIAIIPNQAGNYVLPEISVPWWNTTTDTLEYARIPAREVSVAGLAAVADMGMAPTAAPQVPGNTVVKNKAAVENAQVIPEASPVNGFWQGLSAGLALAWLLTLLLWWHSRRTRVANTSMDKGQVRMRQALKEVEMACRAGVPHDLKEKLLLWAGLYWSESPPRSLGEIGKRGPAELAAQIAQLNKHLYSKQDTAWDGNGFWQVFKASQPAGVRQENAFKGELEPLYRL